MSQKAHSMNQITLTKKEQEDLEVPCLIYTTLKTMNLLAQLQLNSRISTQQYQEKMQPLFEQFEKCQKVYDFNMNKFMNEFELTQEDLKFAISRIEEKAQSEGQTVDQTILFLEIQDLLNQLIDDIDLFGKDRKVVDIKFRVFDLISQLKEGLPFLGNDFNMVIAKLVDTETNMISLQQDQDYFTQEELETLLANIQSTNQFFKRKVMSSQ